jgi:hypothetical protein
VDLIGYFDRERKEKTGREKTSKEKRKKGEEYNKNHSTSRCLRPSKAALI